MRRAAVAAAQLLLCAALVAGECSELRPPTTLVPLQRLPRSSPCRPARAHAGLQPLPADVRFRLAAPEQAIAVGSEQALRAALASADLGWRDRRVVQLTADIALSATLVISGPVRLQGNCAGAEGARCVLRGALPVDASLPLLHVTGPAALVELANLELAGGVGAGSLAGGLTVSNHSLVEAVGVRLAGNTAASGGAARVDSHARLVLTACELADNAAEVRGQAGICCSQHCHLAHACMALLEGCCSCWCSCACPGHDLCAPAN